jgi:hypothetical protein
MRLVQMSALPLWLLVCGLYHWQVQVGPQSLLLSLAAHHGMLVVQLQLEPGSGICPGAEWQ